MKIISPESKSDNKMLVQVMSAPKKRVMKKPRKTSIVALDVITEKQEY
jgi:hypothetical protein